MAYEKTIWKNNEAPKINATNLNKMENGIANAVETDSIARVNNVVSKNLFNKNLNIVNSAYIDASGNIITSDTTLSYQNLFIKVEPNTSYTISSGSSTIYRIAEYDTNKSFIQRVFNDDNRTSWTFTTSSTTQYIKMAGVLTTEIDNLQLEEGSTATDYVPYLNLEEAMQPKGVTLFDGATGGNVVLSDTPSNYNTLDIYYNVGNTTLVQTVKASSAYFVLTLSEMDAKVSGNMGIINHYKNYIVNDKTFVVNAAGRLFKYQNDANVTQDTIDYIWIMKVIGYK